MRRQAQNDVRRRDATQRAADLLRRQKAANQNPGVYSNQMPYNNGYGNSVRQRNRILHQPSAIKQHLIILRVKLEIFIG